MIVGDLKPLERFADKSAENLVKAIEERKEIELSRFIYGLGRGKSGISSMPVTGSFFPGS